MTTCLSANSFFDLSDFEHRGIFDGDLVWEALTRLKEYMADQVYLTLPVGVELCRPLAKTLVLHDGNFRAAEGLDITYGDVTKGGLEVCDNGRVLAGASVIMAGVVFRGEGFRIGEGVLIEAGAMLVGPTILGDWTEVRQGAYLRGNCLVGRRCVIGHVTEVKHTIFLDDAKAGHFAYLGDTILGNRVNLGAGTKMANLRFVGGNVSVRTEEGAVDTGLRKLGAVLGDQVQTGCNSVTNPGTLIGRRSFLLPNTTAPSGYHPENTMIRG
jgi:bifunctional N-acetylglucosamine-1-phosphate-uridyltransferase/glucosamine-1-phosphate-acetyltransferase GlmU-like protein